MLTKYQTLPLHPPPKSHLLLPPSFLAPPLLHHPRLRFPLPRFLHLRAVHLPQPVLAGQLLLSFLLAGFLVLLDEVVELDLLLRDFLQALQSPTFQLFRLKSY